MKNISVNNDREKYQQALNLYIQEKSIRISEKKIVSITKNAQNRVLTLLHNYIKKNNLNEIIDKIPIFRIEVKGGMCAGFQYEFQISSISEDLDCENDIFFVIDDIHCAIDKFSSNLLIGSTIDYVQTLASSQFQVNNPNSKSNCGCGKSFSA